MTSSVLLKTLNLSFYRVEKGLREKEKMLDISIFSFSHNDFKTLFRNGRQKLPMCGKMLTKAFPCFFNSSHRRKPWKTELEKEKC